MMSSVVGRSAFSQLHADGHRYRSGPIRCRFVATGKSPRRAFAIGKKFGPAVKRNRARRRLVAAIDTVSIHRDVPVGDFLFSCSPSVLHMEYTDLVQAIEHVFDRIARDWPAEVPVIGAGAPIEGAPSCGHRHEVARS